MTTVEKLNRIFCEVFEDEELVISQEMTADDVDGWDSLTHVNLILAIEYGFNIRFSQKELLSFKNVGDLMKCIERKVAV